MKKLRTLVLLLCLSATAAFAYPSAMTKDTLVVGTHGTFPPYEHYLETGELVGYDIDVINSIAEKLGKKVEWVDMAFDGLIPALVTHKIDIIAAAMSATPERQKKISFTITPNPTVYDTAFYVLKGNAKSSVKDFEGKTIAVQLGSIQDIYAHTIKDVVIKNFQKLDECMLEVLYGRVDAALMSGATGYNYSKSKDMDGKFSACCLLKVGQGSKGTAFGIAKGDPELVAAMDKVIEKMKASGEVQALRDKWGLDDWIKSVKN